MPAESLDTEWNDLVRSIEGDVGIFVDEFITEFLARSPYGDIAVDESDLRETSRAVFTALITKLWDAPQGESALPVGEQAALDRRLQEFGRLRALQGISITAVVEIMRLDFIVLWRGLAKRSTPQTQRALIANAERVQAAVDEISSQVRVAFMQQQAAMRNDARVSAHRHLERLFNAPELSQNQLESIAQALGVDQHEVYDVLVAGPSHAAQLEQALAPYLAAGSAWGIYVRQAFCAFYPVATARGNEAAPTASPEVADALAPEESCGLDRAREMTAKAVSSIVLPAQRGIGAVRACSGGLIDMAAAVEASGVMGDKGPIAAEEALPIALSSYAYHLLPGGTDEPVNCMERLPDKERTKLIDTVTSYFADGSIKSTARALDCHRNTVINRLKHFHEVTGLSPLVPADAFYIGMVLYRLKHPVK